MTSIEDFPPSTFGFTYRVTHIPSGKMYIGKKVLKFTRKAKLTKKDLECGLLDLFAEKTSIFSSKGEARRMINSNAVSINKEKINLEFQTTENSLIDNKYLLVQKGKKNYFLIKVS